MLNDYPGPHPVQFQGSAWARRVLCWLGWQVHFDGVPTLQGVAIVYPHTSNWDFVYAMLAKAAIGIPIRFWAKDSLFAIPLFGAWLTSLGGVPIDRSSPAGVVQDTIHRLQQARQGGQLFWLGLAPEGTRSYRPGWRSGFYRLALGAGLPLAVATLDYGRREVRVQHFLDLTGDVRADYDRIRAIAGHAMGHNPYQASPIQPMPPIDPQETS
jgi:1-acyl-sn-glycerol-3-phosphate acyltransferase